MSSWDDLAKQLEDGMAWARANPPELPRNVPLWIRCQTMGLNEQADDLLRAWAQTNHLPELSGTSLRTLVALRMQHALERCVALHRRGTDRPSETTEIELGILVTTAWYREGLQWAAVRYPPRPDS
jgi:hypothetical protein